MRLRSLLFVPGDRPERFAKAAASGADAIILDLEDSVPEAERPAARRGLRAAAQNVAQGGADVVVLDSRPFDEYARVSIPSAVNVPGAELVLRARDVAPSSATRIVVNCAGRTRSIIGAQSLINAGLPNPVVALRNASLKVMQR